METVIGDDDLINLDTAVALAFPDGSITVAALRKQVVAKRVAGRKFCGRWFTTLRAIRTAAAPWPDSTKAPISCSPASNDAQTEASSPTPSGKSTTEIGASALAALLMHVNKPN